MDNKKTTYNPNGCGKRVYNYDKGWWGDCGDRYLKDKNPPFNLPVTLLCEVCGIKKILEKKK